MKIILENWKTFVKQSENDCGVLYLKENKTITEKPFTEQLSLISESNDEQVNEFLATWSESVDYALSQDILEEGVMDIVKQAANTLKKLGTKSWNTVRSVTQKILGVVERFKEKNPKVYKAIVGACIAVLAIGLFYLTAKSLDMNAVTTAMEQLVNMQIPDVKISEIVRDFTSQGTVDALREAYQQLQQVVGEYIGDMQLSDNQIISDLGNSLNSMMSNTTKVATQEKVFNDLFQQAAAERAAAGM